MTPVKSGERAAEIIEALKMPEPGISRGMGGRDQRLPSRPTRASHSARYPAGPTAGVVPDGVRLRSVR